jgi:hypothetical protein
VLTVSLCTITANEAKADGGGFYLNGLGDKTVKLNDNPSIAS